MLTQTSLHLALKPACKAWYHTLSHHLALCCKASSTARRQSHILGFHRDTFSCSSSTRVTFPVCFNGAAADRTNRPNTSQTHRPLNSPLRLPHHQKLQTAARQQHRSLLGQIRMSIRQKQRVLVRATTGSRKHSHPHSSLISPTTDMHAWPGAPQKTHSWHWTFFV